MANTVGVLVAILSSALGGTAVTATRFVVEAADPLTIGALRFGVGSLFLAPTAMLASGRWPPRNDWSKVFGLGLLFFGLFPVLFNASLLFTTAARGALALSTLPLLTLILAAALGIERLSFQKVAGIVLAVGGVAATLLTDLDHAPNGAWLGDLLMIAAAFCMALYSIWSRPIIGRSGPLQFTAAAMLAGAPCLIALAGATGGLAKLQNFGIWEWTAATYLGVIGSALIFFLWAFALKHATPSRVTVTVTVNPLAAALTAALVLGEPITIGLIAGLVTVLVGIVVAASPPAGRRANKAAGD